MQRSARFGVMAALERPAYNVPLISMLAAGLILRLLFIGSEGFHNDVGAFESWTLTLRDNPPWMFYAKSGFADYPPGYFVILWVLSKFYAAALMLTGGNESAHGWSLLRIFVKLPAIAMDLVNVGLVYAIVRRFAAPTIALVAAGFLAFNPAAIYVSSYWGQVDSVSWGLLLVSLWCVLRSGDDPAKSTTRLVWAWLAFAFSVLIKPQGATIGLLFLAYPFATSDLAVRALRLRGTAFGLAAAAALTIAIGLLFHPQIDVLGWLLGRYEYGSSVYAYNTVNAFNLYALLRHMWQPDNTQMSLLGLPAGPLSLWGILLVVGATALIIGRYLQRRDDRALLEAALLCALAFFVLATRMHERYIYGAFLFAIPLIAFGRSGLISSIVLTITMYLNLAYSLAYQTVMEQRITGVDASNLWPLVSHPAALANVVLFFWLGYRYLGGALEPGEAPARQTASVGAGSGGAWWSGLAGLSGTGSPLTAPRSAPGAGSGVLRALAERTRGWFSPREGLVSLTRQDWYFIGGFVVVGFVVAIVNYGWPNERIFDEIYFARAGEEYLRGVNQFEWTHPPFTKLVIALSMLLFGGLHGLGNTGYGWRFLNIVIGSCEIGLIYAFAKRITASTLFASLAALMLAFDGFHFVEARLATGEITISTLILLVLYALYRFWINVQIRVQPVVFGSFGLPFIITMAAGVPVAAIFSWLANLQPAWHNPEIASGIAQTTANSLSYTVAFVYAMLGAYVVARVIVPRFLPVAGWRASYADGTVVYGDGVEKPIVQTPPGPLADGLAASITKDGTLRYATPDGAAVFTPDGTMTVDDGAVVRAKSARTWLIVLLVAMGLLASSKWNGAFDFVVVGAVVVLVWAQRFIPMRALYGNPGGFTPDALLATITFVAATIYAISYLPFFLLGHGLSDLIALQQQMYWYHENVRATHPYSSVWWQWPIMQVPISYYYHDFRTGAALQNGAACCVAEILALPNPLVFLLGLISVPWVGFLAWRERNKGYALLFATYFIQWLPWVGSPRLMFEYHFFPNLAVIVLCNAVLIQRLYAKFSKANRNWYLGGYATAVVLLFAYFYPVLAGVGMSYDAWHDRMWPDRLGIPHTSWIVPPR
jgi:dolichyl-phosphate-mannose--protein O-mannosyl transferase